MRHPALTKTSTPSWPRRLTSSKSSTHCGRSSASRGRSAGEVRAAFSLTQAAAHRRCGWRSCRGSWRRRRPSRAEPAAPDNRRRYAAEAGDFRLKPRLHRTRNRKFESISLQRRVCKPSVPQRRSLSSRLVGGWPSQAGGRPEHDAVFLPMPELPDLPDDSLRDLFAAVGRDAEGKLQETRDQRVKLITESDRGSSASKIAIGGPSGGRCLKKALRRPVSWLRRVRRQPVCFRL